MLPKYLVGLVLSAICIIYPSLVNSHGYLLEPPNRSSVWRVREQFPQYDEVIHENFEDNQLFCGGVVIQYDYNNGKCGECGDAYNQTRPRDNENGGYYGQGIVVRNYTQGQRINLFVRLTANHWGHFQFRLCPLKDRNDLEDEECFLRNVLEFDDGTTEYHVLDEEVMDYNISLKLPPAFKCNPCVMQWHYNTGNSWGLCPNGTEGLGCGTQEIFRGCADIAIN